MCDFVVFGVDTVHPDLINRGPYFIDQPQDVMFQLQTDSQCGDECPQQSVSFSCEAGGYPHPQYIWYTEDNNQVCSIKQVC